MTTATESAARPGSHLKARRVLPAGGGGHRRRAPRDLCTSCIRGRVGSIHRPRAARPVGACVHRPCRPRTCRSWGSSPRAAGRSSPAPTRSSCLAGTRHLGAALGRVAAGTASHAACTNWRPRLWPRRWRGSPPLPPWRWRLCTSTGKPPGRSQEWWLARRSWRTDQLSSFLANGRLASRLSCPPPLSLGTELLLAALGAALAAVCLTNPWLAPFAVAPLLLLRQWFEIPLLEHQARRDAKTGLYNARYFELAVDRELGESQGSYRHPCPCC